VVRKRKGQERMPAVCIKCYMDHIQEDIAEFSRRYCGTFQEDVVGKASSLQLHILGSFFPSLSFDLNIMHCIQVLCSAICFFRTTHMEASRMVSSSKKNFFSDLSLSPGTKDQI